MVAGGGRGRNKLVGEFKNGGESGIEDHGNNCGVGGDLSTMRMTCGGGLKWRPKSLQGGESKDGENFEGLALKTEKTLSDFAKSNHLADRDSAG